MSDYMFMLENHLSADQNRAVSVVQSAADRANVNLFLTGGAVRDMLGGFRIRDLDFTVEGNALKVGKTVAELARAKVVATDEHRRSVDLLMPGGVTAEIAMARQERWPKPGGQPVINHASIQEDLLSRDFTVNAIALSLNQASLGLLLDPNNGLADIEHKELRAVHNRVLLDDPGRLLRLFRFRARLSYTIEARTQLQYENARLEEMEKHITGRRLFEELQLTAREPNPGEVLQELEHEKFLAPFAPFLAGAKLNLAGFARLMKARQLVPFGVDLQADSLALFLHLLLEKLAPKEVAALAKALEMRKAEVDLRLKLASNAKKLEKELRSAKLSKASHLYSLLSQAAGEEIMFLYLTSSQRLVQDRIRNYFQKYIPAAQEISDRDIAALGHEPGSPKFKKAKEEMIKARLDSRPKRPVPEMSEAATAPVPVPPGPRPHGKTGYGR